MGPFRRLPPTRDETLPALPTAPAAQTLGLAQIYETGASRVQRRAGRPYEKVVRLAEGETPPRNGYRLRLEGRFSGYPDGRMVRCWAESAEHRPVCLYAVTLDRVSFETATGETLAEWRD